MKPIPTVPMFGWDATGAMLQTLVTEHLLPRLERHGAVVFFPAPSNSEHSVPIPFRDWGTMGVRERPYLANSPQFLFLLAGQGWVHLKGAWYHLKAGQGIFVPQGCPYFPHGMVDNLVLEGHWLWVGIHQFGAAIHHCRLTPDAHFRSPIYAIVDERIFWLFQEWETEAIVRGYQNSLVSKGLLLALFHLLTESASIPLSVWAEINLMLSELPPVLANAVIRLTRTYDRSHNLEEVSEQCGVSLFYMCRLFRRYLKMTPRTYVRQLRLKVAKQLLVETRLSPLKVSQLVGYSNYNHFRKQFQQTFGAAPSTDAANRFPDVRIAPFISKVVP